MKDSFKSTLLLGLKYLLLMAFLVLIGDGVYESWKHGSSFKWIITLASCLFVTVFVLTYVKISLESRIWFSYLFILVMLLLHAALYGTSYESGYTLFGVPVQLLVNVLFGAIITIPLIMGLIDSRIPRLAKIPFLVAGIYSLTGIVVAIRGKHGLEESFAGIGLLKGLPFYLQPMFFALFLYLPLLILFLIFYIIQGWVKKTPRSSSCSYLALSLIVALLLAITSFMSGYHPAVTLTPEKFESLKGRVNLLSQWQGGEVVECSSQQDVYQWAACNLNDGIVDFREDGGGWSSMDGAPFPHEVTFELAEEASPVDQIVLYSSDPAQNRGVKDFELLGKDSEDFHTVGKFSAKNRAGPQVFSFKPEKVKFLKLAIRSNWGDGRSTSMYELEASGKEGKSIEPGTPSKNLLSFEEGAQVLAPDEDCGQGNLIKETGGTCEMKGKATGEIVLALSKGAPQLINTILLDFSEESDGVKDFEIYLSEQSPVSGYKKAGHYTHISGERETKVSFTPRLARFIKIRILSAHAGKKAAISKIRAFQPPLASPRKDSSGLAQGLSALYYKGETFKDFHLEKVDETLDFKWGTAAPEGMGSQSFFIHWKGYLKTPRDGLYELGVKADDGFALSLDGKYVMESLQSTSPETWNREFFLLPSGLHPVEIYYRNREGNARFSLCWRKEGERDFSPIPRANLFRDTTPVERKRAPRMAAQEGINWLSDSALSWHRKKRCYGCHVQTQALMGFVIGKKNSYEVHPENISTLSGFLQTGIKSDGSLCFQHADNLTSQQFVAMAISYCDEFTHTSHRKHILELADWLVTRQDGSGAFLIDKVEAPIQQGSVMTTTNSLLCIQRAFEYTNDPKYRNALDRAISWLQNAQEQTTQDLVFQIIGLSAVDPIASKKVIRNRIERLYALQKGDGGWSETEDLGSNNYATGQALYALKVARTSIADSRFSKGVEYLLDNQKVFGSWPSKNSHTNRPSDYAPTMWAVIGLAGSFESFIVSFEAPRYGDSFALADYTGKSGEMVARVYNFSEGKTKEVEFFVDGKSIGRCMTSPYRLPWNPGELSPGAHTLKCTGVSETGLTSSDEIDILITGNLGISIITPKPRETVTGRFTITSEVRNEKGSPVKEVEYLIDGKSIGFAQKSTTFPLEFDFAKSSRGEHTLKAIVRNEKNEEGSAEQPINIDESLAIEIREPAEGASLDRAITLSSDVKNNTGSPVKKVDYYIGSELLGSSVTQPYSVSGDVSKLAAGAQVIKAIAVTESGETAEDRVNVEICHPFEVTFYATVTDPGGRHIVNLTKDDFAVIEDKVPQKNIQVEKTTDQMAVSAVLVLDGSGSMKGSTGDVVTAAANFLNLLSPKDKAAILFFSNNVELVSTFSGDREKLRKAIARLGAHGGTALYDGICRASMLQKEVKDRRAIILLTDGKDENDPGTAPGSVHTLAESLKAAKENDCIIYTIGLGKGVDEKVLKQLAEATGGRYYSRPRPTELSDAYRMIAEELRCQYIISFFSSNTKKNGAWREVNITTPGKQLRAHTKKGYYAPSY